MERMQLAADRRVECGTRAVRRVRARGQVPGVVYRAGQPTVVVSVSGLDLHHVLGTRAGENAVITLTVRGEDGGGPRTVMVKDVQHHPTLDAILHVDFAEISLTERISVAVPIKLTGEPVGVKQQSGRLVQVLWEVEVECLPTEIPERLEANVEALRVGEALHVRQVPVSAGVTVIGDPERVVVEVQPPVVEEAPPEAAAAEPEVLKQKKEVEIEGGEAGKERDKEKEKEKKGE